MDFRAGQQIFDVLGDAGRHAAPFAASLPDADEICRRLRFFEQNMKFVDVIARCLPLIAVGADAVPDKVLQDQHCQRLELVAQLLDVKAHQPVIELHARMVVEIVKRAGNIQFQCRHNAAHLRFRLPFQAFIQIAQRRHVLRLRVFDILFIDDRQAAVDHGVRFCGDVALSVHDDFAEGQNQLRLEPQHVVHVFFQLNIHRVDVIVAVR